MHANALTKEAARLFPRLARFKSFYLVGGTALALQIGHRISVDFDLFSEKPLPERILQSAKRVFENARIEVTLRTPEQVNFFIDGVKTTFFNYPYPVVLPFVRHDGVSMAAIKEIAAMKAFAISQRLSYKDYVDWYFLLHEGHVNLKEIIDIAARKYGGDFNDRLFLEQLASLSDIRTDRINFLRDEAERKTIERFLAMTVHDFKF